MASLFGIDVFGDGDPYFLADAAVMDMIAEDEEEDMIISAILEDEEEGI